MSPRVAVFRIVMCIVVLSAGAAHAATITVNTPVDTVAVDGVTSLREAIESMNGGTNLSDVIATGPAYGTSDSVRFNITGLGRHVIDLNSELPPLDVPVTIDGYSQPGAVTNTLEAGALDSVINIVLRGDDTFRCLVVNNGASGAIIGGLAFTRCTFGAVIMANDVVFRGNYFGTEDGFIAAPNGTGIAISAGNFGGNIIGGLTPADKNIISGNGVGVTVNAALANDIWGNYIGLSKNGTTALGNDFAGVAYGTLGGVMLAGPRIGGTTATPGRGPGNVISGNGLIGVELRTPPGTTMSAGFVSGNIIGLDSFGNLAVPNDSVGVLVIDEPLGAGGAGTLGPITIGGMMLSRRNVISGNPFGGVLTAAEGTIVQNNLVGTDITGMLARPNGVGVQVSGGATFSGSATLLNNFISGNSGAGVIFNLTSGTARGNCIGAGIDGSTPLGNGGDGIRVDSSSVIIGGAVLGQPNIIANNGSEGINVQIGFPAVRNASDASILRNSIHDNGLMEAPALRMGINLNASDTVTPNDAGDPDAGPNLLQNHPIISSATRAAGNVTLSGLLNSNASSPFRIEFFSNAACDPNGTGEGRTFIGFTTVTTDAAGNAPFGPLSFALPAEETIITATATNTATNMTSEFSSCVLALGAPVDPSASINDVSENEGNSGTTAFTFTITLDAPSATGATVSWQTVNGTATAPSDFTAATGVATFAPGDTSETVTVLVNGDTAVEPNETFIVELTGASGATISADFQGTGTIVNDDAAALPTLTIFDESAAEGNAGTTTMTFDVTLSAPSATPVTVNFATANGSAVAPADYATATGTVTFAPGDTTETITVNVVADTLFEPTESFTVTLSAPAGATIADGSATGTILNDDVSGEATSDIPTASEWALLMLAMALGVMAIRRL